MESFFFHGFSSFWILFQNFNQQSPTNRAGAMGKGEATMFQEGWVHGKSGACGFDKPSSSHGEDTLILCKWRSYKWWCRWGFLYCSWSPGLEQRSQLWKLCRVDLPGKQDHCQCGGQVALRSYSLYLYTFFYRGGGPKGWFDLGGPAWRALTNNMSPSRVHGVNPRWVTCPGNLAGGSIRVYVKPGSHAWDARFQPTQHQNAVTGMAINGGNGWQTMNKCENFMFCKPSGITLNGGFGLRVTSDSGNIDTQVS